MKMSFGDKRRSACFARDRIKLLLISERLECSPHMMKLIQKDLIKTLKKYIVIDEEHVVLQISQDPAVLYATFPVQKKREE